MFGGVLIQLSALPLRSRRLGVDLLLRINRPPRRRERGRWSVEMYPTGSEKELYALEVVFFAIVSRWFRRHKIRAVGYLGMKAFGILSHEVGKAQTN